MRDSELLELNVGLSGVSRASSVSGLRAVA